MTPIQNYLGALSAHERGIKQPALHVLASWARCVRVYPTLRIMDPPASSVTDFTLTALDTFQGTRSETAVVDLFDACELAVWACQQYGGPEIDIEPFRVAFRKRMQHIRLDQALLEVTSWRRDLRFAEPSLYQASWVWRAAAGMDD